jgi:hypothetical protein
MLPKRVGQVLRRAEAEADFRRRLLSNPGTALAEEGFILTDEEMRTLREHWESWRNMSERAAYERIMALARAYSGPLVD